MPEGTTPAAPAGETEAVQTNSNPAQESQAQAQPQAPAVDLHGFTEEQLADMAKFYASVGGYEQVKSRLSNPQKYAQPVQRSGQQPEQSQTQSQAQPTQPVQPTQSAKLPEGFVSQKELAVERYFKDLASEEKYAAIADQIRDGSVLKEMASMGMNPIDDDYNVNAAQINQFLALKAASVPAKPTTVEPTATPLVDYVEVGEEVANMDQALQVVQQSIKARSLGGQPHPAEAKAREYIQKNWGKK